MSVADRLAEVARGAGYVALSDGWWVTFKVEGTTHRFETFEDDAGYARLILSFTIPANVSIELLLTTANDQNRKTKAVKTAVYADPEDGYVAFTVETFFDDPQTLAATLDRTIAALRTASDEYFGSLLAAGVS